MLKSTTWKVKNGLLALGTLLVTGLVATQDIDTFLYRTDILTFPDHAPFNGTAYPIQKTANWVGLGAEKWESEYNALSDSELLALPVYDSAQLATPTDSLVWGDPEHNKIRNAKISYSVPYMGNYLLDGRENAGSHLAVDIKTPEGTPIFAIANGTVVKASNQSSGFGYHIVLMHKNFPTLDDPSAQSTIYSSYSHLSSLLVEVGTTVNKGQQIALSGSSGTATTPHLHFQIDNDQAPWHPFWPFTWQEASEAGLDFFSAINAGLGKEKALTTTVNPMLYVQKYLDPSTVNSDVVVAEPAVENNVAAEENIEVAEPIEEVVMAPVEEVPVEIVEPVEIIKPVDINGFSDVPEGSSYFAAITYLASTGVIEGYEDGTFRPDQTVNRVESLKFILESIEAALENGDLPFSDVSEEDWYYEYLYTAYKKAIVDGNPDGTFRPNDTVNKAEFFKILFNGLNVDIDPNLSSPPYIDVSVDEWFAPYIAYAKQIGIISSEIDHIYPNQGMTRGEVADAMYELIKLVN